MIPQRTMRSSIAHCTEQYPAVQQQQQQADIPPPHINHTRLSALTDPISPRQRSRVSYSYALASQELELLPSNRALMTPTPATRQWTLRRHIQYRHLTMQRCCSSYSAAFQVWGWQATVSSRVLVARR